MNRTDAAAYLARMAQQRVVVVGDAMLDRYLIGETERISPEAPIPVLRVTEERSLLGGAANVAANIAAIGATPRLATVLGCGAGEREFTVTLAQAGIDDKWLLRDETRPMTVKTRVVARGQQIVRLDRETTAPLANEMRRLLTLRFASACSSAGAVAVADYGKGVVYWPALAESAAGLPVVVDPKGHFDDYYGVTVLKPNRREIRGRSGGTPSSDLALRDDLGVDDLLVTDGAKGMTLTNDAGSRHYPAVAREVADVTGAGDTVAAWLTTALAAGIPIGDAVELANLAAGVVVGKRGVAVVRPGEVLAFFEEV